MSDVTAHGDDDELLEIEMCRHCGEQEVWRESGTDPAVVCLDCSHYCCEECGRELIGGTELYVGCLHCDPELFADAPDAPDQISMEEADQEIAAEQ